MRLYATEFNGELMGVDVTLEIELEFDYCPGVPAYYESDLAVAPAEAPYCQIYNARYKDGKKWVSANWLLDVINMQGKMDDLQIELLNHCDCE